ncbi:MAG: DUF4336 domain-containing protein [Symploca sp. SIO1C2]|nr:DUF4336 domain-containing protein [Symploca sp. SIO1C2]
MSTDRRRIDATNEVNDASSCSRRNFLSTIAATSAMALHSNEASAAATTKESDPYFWPYWGALPVFPFQSRRTLRRTVVDGAVWTFDQLIGIYYVHVPIRMTVVAMHQNDPSRAGLLVYAPVAATEECLSLLHPLIDKYGPIRAIILPTVAVEHKVLAGPFARKFPKADFYVTDKQYSFHSIYPTVLWAYRLGRKHCPKLLVTAVVVVAIYGGRGNVNTRC